MFRQNPYFIAILPFSFSPDFFNSWQGDMIIQPKTIYRMVYPVYLCFYKFKHTGKMKTTTMIISAIFTLQAGFLFGENDGAPVNKTGEVSIVDVHSLVPLTPGEATFEDFYTTTTADIASLEPVVPVEADFSDVAPISGTEFTNLAPITPPEADFNDSSDTIIDPVTLAPATPAQADFE
jgi:hypothetical protein